MFILANDKDQYLDENGEMSEGIENAHQFQSQEHAERYATHMGLVTLHIEEI